MAMDEFNASTALKLAPTIDSIIGFNFQDFISDPRVAVDITPSSTDSISCSLGISRSAYQVCNQVFYMPGTFGDLDILRNGTLPNADLVVVHDMRGYQMNFTSPQNELTFDINRDCGVYGLEMIAFQICFQDQQDGIAISK